MFKTSFFQGKSNLIDIPVLLRTIIMTICVTFEPELKQLQSLASEQNHRFCNENVDIVVDEISLLFNEGKKNDFIEELYYRLNEKERTFLFGEVQNIFVF